MEGGFLLRELILDVVTEVNWLSSVFQGLALACILLGGPKRIGEDCRGRGGRGLIK